MIVPTWFPTKSNSPTYMSLSRVPGSTINSGSPSPLRWEGRTKVNSSQRESRPTPPISYTVAILPNVEGNMIRITNVDYVMLTGCQGSIRIPFSDPFYCQIKNRTLHLTCTDVRSEVQFTTLVGAIYRAMFGVTKGFRNKLKTVGVGYKGILTENQLLKLTLGYSHPVYYSFDPSVRIKFSRKSNKFNLQGPNPHVIHQTAKDLYSFKEPEVYKGKGVRYRGRKLIKKEGKKPKQ